MYKLCKTEKSANRQREVENTLMYMMERVYSRRCNKKSELDSFLCCL